MTRLWRFVLSSQRYTVSLVISDARSLHEFRKDWILCKTLRSRF